MRLTPVGYAHMTAQLASLAGGKIVVALEGGYDLESLSKSSAACLSVLCGGDRDDKVLAAFALFDVNGDGYISKEEMDPIEGYYSMALHYPA